MAKTHKLTDNFFCTSCNALLCNDCKEIALEYVELERLRKQALYSTEDELEKAKQEIASLKRQVEMLDHVAKIGYDKLITAWLDAELAKANKTGKPPQWAR